MKYYLAYGSNLNKQQMAYRCPDAEAVGTAMLKNYRLLFRGSKTGSYLTVEPKRGCEVPLGVWLVNDEDEKALDRYEGFPTFYRKETVKVPCHMTKTDKVETIEAIIYIMNERSPYGMPSLTYDRVCRKGYNDFGFRMLYLNRALIDTKELVESA